MELACFLIVVAGNAVSLFAVFSCRKDNQGYNNQRRPANYSM